jgi:hypothetical protein
LGPNVELPDGKYSPGKERREYPVYIARAYHNEVAGKFIEGHGCAYIFFKQQDIFSFNIFPSNMDGCLSVP